MLLAMAALLVSASVRAAPDPYAYSFAPIPAPEAVLALNPAIKERYSAAYRTCLDDPKATTYSLDICHGIEMKAQDATLNRQWVVRFASFRTARKPALRRAERAWIAARKVYCAKWWDEYQGGTIMPLVYGSCYVDETIRRTIWLEHLR